MTFPQEYMEGTLKKGRRGRSEKGCEIKPLHSAQLPPCAQAPIAIRRENNPLGREKQQQQEKKNLNRSTPDLSVGNAQVTKKGGKRRRGE